jgi:hypothetical protein
VKPCAFRRDWILVPRVKTMFNILSDNQKRRRYAHIPPPLEITKLSRCYGQRYSTWLPAIVILPAGIELCKQNHHACTSFLIIPAYLTIPGLILQDSVRQLNQWFSSLLDSKNCLCCGSFRHSHT